MAEIVVLVTASSDEEASRIVRAVVEQGLAACGNIIPGVRSFFRWEGQVADERETLILLKSVTDRFDELSNVIKKLHSYDVPEVIAVPVVDGLADYLGWVREATKRVQKGQQ